MLLRKKLFTSCGTEANNWILRSSGRFESTAIITSKIEHHAVLYTVQALQKNLVFR
jgi:cysteine desulfurase